MDFIEVAVAVVIQALGFLPRRFDQVDKSSRKPAAANHGRRLGGVVARNEPKPSNRVKVLFNPQGRAPAAIEFVAVECFPPRR
jgi:hypothetical protein